MHAELTPYEAGELQGIFKGSYIPGATIKYRECTLRKLNDCPENRSCWRVEIDGGTVDTFDSTTFHSVFELRCYLDHLLEAEPDGHDLWRRAFENIDPPIGWLPEF